ncbi:MAG: hypothetical protein QG650_939 [Patescibacteria group bacterium]|nr:hypothetical protein [Patescibacteria group bacterium]
MRAKNCEARREEIREKIEALPEEAASASEVRKRKRLVGEMLLLDIGLAEIRECLESQRAKADASERLGRFPHVSPNVLRDRLSRKPSNRFYNAQAAFSLPEDYRMLPDGPSPFSWESEAILDSVFHPEMVGEDFLRDLGIPLQPMGKRKKDSHVQTVKAKIAAIPELKKILSESVPVGPSRRGGKAVAITTPWHPANGMIVSFQVFNQRESKRQNVLSTAAKVYSDAFSYLRSRYYAANFLAEREKSLRESANALSVLLVEYDATPEDGASVGEIREILASRKTFFEQRAYLDRLLSVRLGNRSQDRLRIKGALSDVQKGFLERMGKRMSMEIQARSIESSIERESGSWKSVYRKAYPLLDESSPFEAPERAGMILRLFESYSLTASDFPVRPFTVIRTSFDPVVQELRKACEKGDEISSSMAIRRVDYLLRAQSFFLFCYGLEHSLKTDSIMDGASDSEKLSVIIHEKFSRIESMVFHDLDIVPAMSPRFLQYGDWIREMRALNDEGKIGELVEKLEAIRSTVA